MARTKAKLWELEGGVISCWDHGGAAFQASGGTRTLRGARALPINERMARDYKLTCERCDREARTSK